MEKKLVKVVNLDYGMYQQLPVGLSEDGIIYVANPTVEKLLEWRSDSGREKIASKSFKSFVGEGFKVGKISANLPDIGQGKANYYDFVTFLTIMRWEAKINKSAIAIDLLVDGFGESFRGFVYNVLGEQVDQENRQQYLKARQQGKVIRKTLTDSIKEYLIKHPELDPEYRKWIYAKCTNAIYLHIFNRRCDQLRKLWGIEDQKLFRDSLTEEELIWISQIEDVSCRWINQKDREPFYSVTKVIDIIMTPKSERKIN